MSLSWRYTRNAAASALLCIGLSSAFQQERSLYTWAATAPLEAARHDACAAAISENRILIAGGGGSGGGDLASVEIYRENQTFETGPPMTDPRSHHACVTLNDGRVLVVGGRSEGRALASAETYDPSQNTWAATANAPLARFGQTATLLKDGKVLLVGGESEFAVSDEVELFDPETNRFETLPTQLSARRKNHAVAMIDDDWLLISGGEDGIRTLETSDYFDPLTREISVGPDLPGPRARHTATVLLNGSVLVAGGTDGRDDLASTLLFDNASLSWTEGPQMNHARQSHVALRIPNNGNVLIAGGSAKGVAIASTELYQVDGKMIEVGALTRARLSLVMAAREDGVVLAAGGLSPEGPIAGCGTFIPPTFALNRTRYVRNQNVVVTGQNWPASTVVHVLFPPQINDVAISSSVGAFSHTRANPGTPGQVTTVRVFTLVPVEIVLETTYRTVARTTTVLNATPQAGATYGSQITLHAEVRPEEINGQMGGLVAMLRLIQVTPPPAPPVPQFLTSVNSFAPAPGAFSRNINEFGFFSTPILPPAGPYNFAAAFGENDFYAGSTSATISNYAVGRAASSVSLTSSTTTPLAGSTTSFVATVQSPSLSGGNSAFRPAGTVRFTTDRGASIDAALDTANPPKATAFVPLAAGSVNVTAQYLGSTNHLPSTVTITRTVQKATIPITLISAALSQPSGGGNCQVFRVCFLVAGMSSNPSPTALISLTLPASGGTQTRSLFGGTSTFSFVPATVGTVNLTFNYPGDANYNSTSLTVPLTVVKFTLPLVVRIASTLLVSGGTTAVPRNSSLNIVAGLDFVPPSGVPGPTGTMTLTDSVSTVVSSSTPNPATFQRQYSSPGEVILTISYLGDQFYAPVTETRTLVVN